jgi:hypothetical protein
VIWGPREDEYFLLRILTRMSRKAASDLPVGLKLVSGALGHNLSTNNVDAGPSADARDHRARAGAARPCRSCAGGHRVSAHLADLVAVPSQQITVFVLFP